MDSNYQLLSRRPLKTETYKNAPKRKFFTNYFTVEIDSKKSDIYQFAFTLPEEIPHDSSLYDRAIRSIKNELKRDYGYLCHKGQMIWGTKPCDIPTPKNCVFKYGGTDFKFEAMLAQTRKLNLGDLDSKETQSQLLQILNIDLKNSLRNSDMTEFGKKGQFFPNKRPTDINPEIEKIGLIIERGFKLTLVPLPAGISLQIDVCSSILQRRNLLSIFNAASMSQNKLLYTGTIVQTNYGCKRRTYTIEEVDVTQTPCSTFHNVKKGETMTYKQYYLEVYGLKVTNDEQPLLKVVHRVNQVITGDRIEKVPEYIYLIPEFVSPTGLTEEQRNEHAVMKAIAPYIKLDPNQRYKNSEEMVKKINSSEGLISIKNPHVVEGLILNRPQILYGGAMIKPNEQGLVKNRGVLHQTQHFKDWLVVYSSRPNSQRDQEEVDQSVATLIKAGATYGITFEEPVHLTVTGGNVESWRDTLMEDIKIHGEPEIILFLVNPKEEKFYKELKKLAINVIKRPSQFIKRRTLSNPKGALSAASKIAIQMNVKMGCTPWIVSKSHEYFKSRNVMYGAVCLSKGKNGYTLAFVGTISNDCTQIYSDVRVNIARKEEIPVNTLEQIFVEWAKSYFQNNKRKVPETIILYREGLSDSQIQDQIPRTEIPALQNMIAIIGDKTKTKNYKPETICIVVNKKINSRYYSMESKMLNNPDSGSVVIEPFNTGSFYSFHLAAQQVTQGTCTPTVFKVVHDRSKMPKEALITFTFEQCFNYYNWEGAVRVPACLQSADKLAKLFGESVQENINTSAKDANKLMKNHFFL